MPAPKRTPTRWTVLGAVLLSALLVSACTGDMRADFLAEPPPSGVRPEEPDTDQGRAEGPDQGPSWRPPKEEEDPPFEPAPAVMPRLTQTQYRNATAQLLGQGMPEPPVEADTNPYLFYNIGASTTTLSGRGVEQYTDGALELARAALADPTRRQELLGCAPESLQDACVEAFIRDFGRRAFRRPMTDEQLARWRGLAERAATLEGQGPIYGLETMIAGMLQSPRFLYRRVEGQPDPERPDRRRYTSFEMAERVAFLLWNAPPDDELLEAAARGELTDEASLRAQAWRMLDDERARRAVQDFFAQYLDLRRLEQVERPGLAPGLPAAMEVETRLLVDDLVFRRQGDVRDLFRAPRGYVNSELAEHYGVVAPGATPITFVPVEFGPDSPRAGWLTLGAFLTANAHATETSPTLRGVFVNKNLLCREVPAPPDDIDLDLSQDADMGEATTLRERLERHQDKDGSCFGCHSFIDPPGFLLEHFDSVGRYRETEGEHPIDASGEMFGEELYGARDLAAHLTRSEEFTSCLVRQLYRHAQGRADNKKAGESYEEGALPEIERDFAASGYRFQELLVAVITSEGFRTFAAPGQ